MVVNLKLFLHVAFIAMMVLLENNIRENTIELQTLMLFLSLI